MVIFTFNQIILFPFHLTLERTMKSLYMKKISYDYHKEFCFLKLVFTIRPKYKKVQENVSIFDINLFFYLFLHPKFVVILFPLVPLLQ